MYTAEGSLARIDPESTKRILVFGDIHGDLQALKKGLELRRSGDVVVFLGDYADRGAEGVEVIEGIDALLRRLPGEVIALQGNHELFTASGEPTFAPCTLIEEAARKRGSWEAFFGQFSQFIDQLFAAAVLPEHYLFLHGGLGDAVREIDDLVQPNGAVKEQLLWSDPMEGKGTMANMRGAGSQYGPDVTDRVLNSLGVRTLIRSHEPRKSRSGPAFDQEGRIVTVSSTGVYDGRPFLLELDLQQPPHSPEEMSDAVRFL
jgi:protein phosphatase